MKFDEDTKFADVWLSFRQEALPELTTPQKAWAMLGFYGCAAALLRMVTFLNDPDEFVDRMHQFQAWSAETEEFISKIAEGAEEEDA